MFRLVVAIVVASTIPGCFGGKETPAADEGSAQVLGDRQVWFSNERFVAISRIDEPWMGGLASTTFDPPLPASDPDEMVSQVRRLSQGTFERTEQLSDEQGDYDVIWRGTYELSVKTWPGFPELTGRQWATSAKATPETASDHLAVGAPEPCCAAGTDPLTHSWAPLEETPSNPHLLEVDFAPMVPYVFSVFEVGRQDLVVRLEVRDAANGAWKDVEMNATTGEAAATYVQHIVVEDVERPVDGARIYANMTGAGREGIDAIELRGNGGSLILVDVRWSAIEAEVECNRSWCTHNLAMPPWGNLAFHYDVATGHVTSSPGGDT